MEAPWPELMLSCCCAGLVLPRQVPCGAGEFSGASLGGGGVASQNSLRANVIKMYACGSYLGLMPTLCRVDCGLSPLNLGPLGQHLCLSWGA